MFSRNAGYVSPEGQWRLQRMRLLIAGCGMGSMLAEALVRMGVGHLRLVDHDVVGQSNLNRQNFLHADIGRPKATALADRLVGIRPDLDVDVRTMPLSQGNAGALVEACDVVVDTIDFIALPGIVALHDQAGMQGVPVVSALNIGFGGGMLFLPPGGEWPLRRLLDLPASGAVDAVDFRSCYAGLIQRIACRLDPEVAAVMASALSQFEDGRPCPAAQVAAGSMSMAALVATVVARIAMDQPVPASPSFVLLSLADALAGRHVDLRPARP